ncbi:hypothetical protein QF035_000377 [Streptomyces umbrinus]|uniref:MFS transporter n=1 Tax=Streptomyces umbrinus TaxID=67370 RepID=A0ABU0SGV6_9ACTN|nr:hypothetical protein [Streptomyces umbrinus]
MESARSAANRWTVLGILSLSLLVVALDLTVLNVALPTLSTELEPSSVQLLWIVDIYSLAVAGLLIGRAQRPDPFRSPVRKQWLDPRPLRVGQQHTWTTTFD